MTDPIMAELRDLEKRVAALEDSFRVLNKSLGGDLPKALPSFVGSEGLPGKVLMILLVHSPKLVSYELLRRLLWDDLKMEDARNVLAVTISGLRAGVTSLGIEIKNTPGRGYFMPVDSAEKLRGMLASK